jgi:hypothetical protein
VSTIPPFRPMVTPAIESFREQNTNVFWPGTEPAETVTGDPPTDIDAEASGGTS